MRPIVIGTAGHIDHGKTALVKAITGIDPSRLREEKTRGITIDLGFAHRIVAARDGASLQLSFVDVPGHSAFIRNMLAGVGGIDIVLLVISAEEGVKPQTREHLAICSLLGIRRGIAVLSKADAVSSERLAVVREEVRVFLKGSFLEGGLESGPDWPLPTSAQTGDGLGELAERLTALAGQIESRDGAGLVRLPIDRSFSMRGFGTVVTGTLMAGTIEVDQKLRLEPGGRDTRIRSIQVHGQSCDRAPAGSRVALNLAGIDHSSVVRGDTIVAAETLAAVDEIDAEVTLLPDAAPLKHGSRVTFHAYTSDSPAAILLYSQSRMEPGSMALARLKLGRPVVLVPGDRFILRLPSPSETIAGGTVLDAAPLPKQSRLEARRWLASLRDAGESAERRLLCRVTRRQMAGLDLATAVREMGMTPARIREISRRCVVAGKLGESGRAHFFERELYEMALRRIETEVTRYHVSSPEQAGIKRADLQARTSLPSALFNFAVDELTTGKVIGVGGDTISRYGFAARLIAGDPANLDALARIYAKAGLETPALRDVVAELRLAEREVQRLLVVLVKESVLVKIGNNAYVHRDRLAELRRTLAGMRGKSMDVPHFKQITGLSRKHAIPWLEFLDRERITRRVGDARLVL